MSVARAARVSGFRWPWWGTSPWRLAVRGLVHLVLGAALAWGCAQVASGGADVDDTALAEHAATVERVATIVLALAVLVALAGLARLVVGAIDIASPRRVVRGRLVRAGERMPGDHLPGLVRVALHWFWYRRRDHHDHHQQDRRRWYELVVAADGGERRFAVSSGAIDGARPGMDVAVHASRILSHVREVEVLAGR